MAISNASRAAAAAALLFLTAPVRAQTTWIPPRPSPAVESIVGEYGESPMRFVIREKDRVIEVSHDGKTFEPVREVGSDHFADTRFDFRIERGVPEKKARGKHAATSIVKGVSIGNIFLPRRDYGGGEGFFRITPLKPVPQLMKEARALAPPKETGDFLPSRLVDVRSLDKSIALDVRYATSSNFLGTPVYKKAQVMMQLPAAQAVARANRALRLYGYGLLLHDGYRPWFVTWLFWNATPPASREFVADPAEGSKHNRGCAIDLTLYDLKTKKALELTGLYDEMSPRSYPDYPGGTSRQRALRDLLRKTMENEGFTVYESEWWHFDYKDWKKYAISNQAWWK